MKKSYRFFALLVALVFLFEVFVRINVTTFSSLTDRVRLKAAMFNARKPTEFLFVGSSRFKDGISPNAFSDQFKKETGIEISGFNGATTGANLPRMKWYVENTIAKEGLKYLVLEISPPHLKQGKLGFNLDGTKIHSDKDQSNLSFSEKLETKVSDFLYDSFYVIKYRNAFKIQNFARLVGIIGANYFEGSDWFRRGTLDDFINRDNQADVSKADSYWIPKSFDSLEVGSESKKAFEVIKEETRNQINTLKILKEKADENNVTLIFVAPPIASSSTKKECSKESEEFLRTLKQETGSEVLTYACGNIPARWFYDRSTHLNKEGRTLYSRLLAKDLKGALGLINQEESK